MVRVWKFTLVVLFSIASGIFQHTWAQSWQRIITPTGSGEYVTPYFLNSEIGFTFIAGLSESRGDPNIPGSNSTRLARTTNGGASWVIINYFDSIGCQITQLCFVSLTHGYASTVSLFGGDSNGIYETFDQGLHWKKITPGSIEFESVYAAGGTIFAVEISDGFGGELGTQVIFSGNDGVSWDSVPRPGTEIYPVPPYYGGFQWVYGNRDSLVASIYLYPDANVYLVYSSDLGKHWQSVLVDQNYQWPMEALFIVPHSCRIFREFLDNQDLDNDTYSFLRADPPYTGWNFSIQHLETGAWIAGNNCASYLSYAGQQFSRGPVVRSRDEGTSWPFVGNSHTDGREPDIDEIDDDDWQNLSVVGYGAVVYAMGTNFSGYLWKTTDGGDGTVSESALAPRIVLERTPFFSGNDTLVTSLCTTSQVAVSIQNLTCAITKLDSFGITGLSGTEFADSLVTHNDCLSLPDSIFLTIAPTSTGIRPVTVNMTFIDDEFHEKDTSLTFILEVNTGTTVPFNISLGSGPIVAPAGDTISVAVYLSGNATLGATTISLPFALDTSVLVPVGFQPAIVGITATMPIYHNGILEIELQSPGLDVSGDTLLGYLRCVAYVGDSLSTVVSLPTASLSSQIVPCLALSLAGDSVTVNIVGCGLPQFQQLMQSGKVSLTIRSIAPNPAMRWVRVEFGNATSSPVSYRVLDALGTVRAEGESLDSAITVDTYALPSGLYYVRACTANGTSAVGKFVIER